jgi:3-deoxy-D-manno-octulosonate 8-phosphate phosphatase KdsC-like HAD superfamily phosphatase
MKNLLEKASHIHLLIIDVDGALTNGSLELFSRIRGIIDSSHDGNG